MATLSCHTVRVYHTSYTRARSKQGSQLLTTRAHAPHVASSVSVMCVSHSRSSGTSSLPWRTAHCSRSTSTIRSLSIMEPSADGSSLASLITGCDAIDRRLDCPASYCGGDGSVADGLSKGSALEKPTTSSASTLPSVWVHCARSVTPGTFPQMCRYRRLTITKPL